MTTLYNADMYVGKGARQMGPRVWAMGKGLGVHGSEGDEKSKPLLTQPANNPT